MVLASCVSTNSMVVLSTSKPQFPQQLYGGKSSMFSQANEVSLVYLQLLLLVLVLNESILVLNKLMLLQGRKKYAMTES